ASRAAAALGGGTAYDASAASGQYARSRAHSAEMGRASVGQTELAACALGCAGLSNVARQCILMRILALTNLYPNPQQPNRATFNRQQFRELARQHELRVIAPVACTDELRASRDGQPRLPKH